MSESNPHQSDLVLGGQNPPPSNAAILGGLAGIKQRLASESISERLHALNNASQYGNKAIDLALQSLQDPAEEIKRLARRLLRDRLGSKGKEALLEREPLSYFRTFNDWRREIYNPEFGITEPENNAYVVRMTMNDWGAERKFNGYDLSQFELLIEDPRIEELQALIFQIEECFDMPDINPPLSIALSAICDEKNSLKNLIAIHFEDLGTQRFEFSNIKYDPHLNIQGILQTFSDLEILHVQGCFDLYLFDWNGINHNKLKSLVVTANYFECVYVENINLICNMLLPALEYFEICLGQRTWIEQFQALIPLMKGITAPHLRCLKIQATEKSNELIDIMAESRIIQQLDILDLSSGSITDEGANKLFNCPYIQNLKSLNISSNSLSTDGIKLLQQLSYPVDTTDQDIGRYRYCTSGE